MATNQTDDDAPTDETRIYGLADDGVRVEREYIQQDQSATHATYRTLVTDVTTAGVLINDWALGEALAGQPGALDIPYRVPRGER